MATPQSQFDLSDIAQPPARVSPRPRRAPRFDLSDIAEPSPRSQAPARVSRPYGAFDSSTAGEWKIDDAPKVKDWYKQTYGRELPVSAFGESATHRRMNLDHSNSMDVGLNPASEEGRAFTGYLRQNNIPFLAYDRAVPGAATAAHIHVGFPSHGGLPSSSGLDLSDIAEPAPAADDEVVKTEATLDSQTGGPLSLTDARRKVPVGASTVQVGDVAAPSMPPLRQSEAPDARTFEGRRARDAGRAIEASPQGRKTIDVHLPAGRRDWSEMSSNDVGKETARQWAAQRGIDPAFVESWLAANGKDLHIYDLASGKPLETGEAMGREDIYDLKTRTFRLSAEMPHLHALEQAYKLAQFKAMGIPGMDEARALEDVSPLLRKLTDDETSPGENFLDVVTPPARAIGKTAAFVARPLQAGSAGFWAGVRGGGLGAFGTAYNTLKTGETPPEGENVIGNAARGSETLARINPRLPVLVGGAADVVLDPVNLLPLGAGRVVGRLAAAGEEAGTLGRVASKLRDAGLFTPVESAAGAFKANDDTRIFGNLARNVDRATLPSELPDIPVTTRSLRVVKSGTGEVLEARPPAESEALSHARDRLSFYEAEAANATNPIKKRNAAALAEDFRAEVGRLEPQPRASQRGADATSDVIRYKGRDIVRVPMPDGTVQPFYRSTGNNSRRAGEWFPFDEVGRDEQGEWFVKDRFASGDMEDPAHPLHRLGDDYNRNVSESLRASDIQPGREVATPDEVNSWLARNGGPEPQTFDLSDIAETPHHSRLQPRSAAGQFAPDVSDIAEPRPSLLRRAFDKGLDVLDVAKSLFASADSSAVGRQAFFPLLMDTWATVKGLAEGSAGVTNRGFGRLIERFENMPIAKEAQGMGLALDSVTGARSEFFPSAMAENIPVYGKAVIAPSDRLMTGQLDAVRLHNYELWSDELRSAGLTPEKNPEEFKSAARMLNILSGKGELGKLGQAIYPVTRRVIFSPKLLKSRFQVLNPLEYARLPPAVRRIALKKAGKAAAKFGGLLGLAALTADEVGFDPTKGNFLHVRYGDTTYDLSGGEASKVVAIFKLAQSVGTTAKAIQNHESVEYKDTPIGVTTHFLRSQLAPGYSIIPDAVTGRTFDNQPFTWTEGTLRRITPGFSQDLYDGFTEGGGTSGVLKALPSFLGVSTRTRDEAAMKKEWALSSRATKEAEAKERTMGVLKDVPANVRDEVQRLRIYLPESDTQSAPLIGEAVARAMNAPGYQKFKYDSERKTYLENLIAGARKRAGLADANRVRREKSAKPEERVSLSGTAGEEVKRLGVVIDPIFKGHGVSLFSGESARFKGESLGQTPEMLEQYRRDVAEATQREIERVMSFSTYASATNERRRVALDDAAKRARVMVRNKFNLGTRKREYGERRGLLDYQRQLESRTPQMKSGERRKL